MNDGELFHAEIDGTTMWIEARRGGNQGKKINIKYRILDIRPVEIIPVAQARSPESGEPLDNAEVVKMVRTGLKEDTLISVIGLRPAHYSLAQGDLDVLRAAGVPETVIKAMIDKTSGR